VMPAWGWITADRDNRWNTDVVTAGLFTYAMAAFARRVADHPAHYPQHRDDAVRFITATIETYEAFRHEFHLVEGDPHAYFTVPAAYAGLQVRVNALLARAGRAERVPLSPRLFVGFANTFLRKIWRHNVLSDKVDGSGDENFNVECAGWIPLAQFDPWVWTRSRDTTFF